MYSYMIFGGPSKMFKDFYVYVADPEYDCYRVYLSKKLEKPLIEFLERRLN